MKNISISFKSVICGLIYIVTSLSIILMLYILDFGLQNTIFLGAFCGIMIALVTCCNTLRRTVIARFMGLLSAVAAQFLLSFSGAPYHIIMYIYRNEDWLNEIGHLTVNELIGYNWGLMMFWFGLLTSFFISILVSFICNRLKEHSK